MKKKTENSGIKENWIMEESIRVLRAEAEKKHGKSRMDDIGKKYERVPHPTLKNTFILREKKN
jgi:hypothetical protein